MGLSYNQTRSPENSLREILGANFNLSMYCLVSLYSNYDLVKGKEDFLFFFFPFQLQEAEGKVHLVQIISSLNYA